MNNDVGLEMEGRTETLGDCLVHKNDYMQGNVGVSRESLNAYIFKFVEFIYSYGNDSKDLTFFTHVSKLYTLGSALFSFVIHL